VREPTIRGTDADAWQLDIPDSPATVACWLVHGMNFHPLWTWWMLTTIHLRDEDGLPPAYKTYGGATHEFQIVSLNPEQKIDIDAIEAGGTVSFLQPHDAVVQFGGVNDQMAKEVNRIAVHMVCSGCSPDSDYRQWWNAAILRAAETIRTGGARVREGYA
jgi:hypothetical protein